MQKKPLGRGLGALIGTPSAAPVIANAEGERVLELEIEKVVASPLQPRKEFQQEALQELSESIKQRGILQPLTVRKVGEKYELIAGERRFRAAQLAGLKKVPAILRQAEDQEVLEDALIENLQRVDLDPLEEADGYAHLIETFHLTQEQIAQRVGKNRATVANALRLRQLPEEVRSLLQQQLISVGHAKVILGVSHQEMQLQVAREVLKKGLNVRQTEELVAGLNHASAEGKKSSSKGSASASRPEWKELEQKIQRALGTRVKIAGSSKQGRIEISYFSGDELDHVLSKLGVDPNS